MKRERAHAADRSNHGVVAVLAFAGTSAAFMQTILVPLLPKLPELLSTTNANAAWVITATLVSGAVCTPIAGRLGDMYGKRRVAMALLVLMTVGSVSAALSTALAPMIIARALQGTAMGVIPLGVSILRDVLSARRLGSAIALVSITLGFGGALGLPLSAVLLQHFDWRFLFWFAAGLAALCVVLYALIVPASTLLTPARLDIAGIIGLALGLIGVLLGLSRGAEWGWTDPRTLLSFGVGGGVLVIWCLVELRVQEPLIDLRVSARSAVLLTNLASIAMGFALFAPNIIFPQLLQLSASTGTGLGVSILVAALVLAPSGLTMLAMAPVAGHVERRHGPKPLLVAGAAVIAMSYAAAMFFHDQVWQILVINIVIGVGFGLGYGSMPALITRAVPPRETGAANGLNALMRALGTSLSSAVLGAVLAQSLVTVNGATGPSEAGFTLSLALGLGAAVVCLGIAAFIPKPAAAV